RPLTDAARHGARERGGGGRRSGVGPAGRGAGDPRGRRGSSRGDRARAQRPAHLRGARPHDPQAGARARAAPAARDRQGGPRRRPPPRRVSEPVTAAARGPGAGCDPLPGRARDTRWDVSSGGPSAERPAHPRSPRGTQASLGQCVQGARPPTDPAALAPVAAGAGAAAWQLETLHGDVDWALVAPRALLALGVSFCLQIGVNYANDYSDGIRGTDDDRVGPFRLTGSGAARPATVRW